MFFSFVWFQKKHRGQLASMCALGFVLFGLLLIRVLLMGAKSPVFASSDNPSSRCSSSLTRTLTFFYLPSFNFFLFIYPKWLSYDWSMDSIPRIASVFDLRNVVSFIFYYVIYKIIKSSGGKLKGPKSQPTVDDLLICHVCKAYLNYQGSNINKNINYNYNSNNKYEEQIWPCVPRRKPCLTNERVLDLPEFKIGFR